MKILGIDFDEIQKAMEDVDREAFDYYLDAETGEVLILSEEILCRARKILLESVEEDAADYEEIEFDEEKDVPDWMEDEVELALEILLDSAGRYVRIPERTSGNGFTAMRSFAAAVNDPLREELALILNGKGVFRNFKVAMERYPREKKMWYSFNAKEVRKEIQEWLNSLGIEPMRRMPGPDR